MLKRQNGFTLIEVVIVVVILGIALAIALPNFSGMLGGASYRDTARDLFQTLRLGRSRAVARNLEQQVWVDIANNRYILVQDVPNAIPPAPQWTPDPAVAINWTNVPAAVALRTKADDCSEANNITFIFYANGTAEIRPGVVPTPAQTPNQTTVCIMEANNLAGPAKYRVSLPLPGPVAIPIISNSGRAVIQ